MPASLFSRSLAVAVIAGLTLAGCARPDEPVEEVAESEPVVEETVEEVVEVPRHPLTGEEVSEGSATGPAVMAKIDHENRPYVNLHRADIVIQQLIPKTAPGTLPCSIPMFQTRWDTFVHSGHMICIWPRLSKACWRRPGCSLL